MVYCSDQLAISFIIFAIMMDVFYIMSFKFSRDASGRILLMKAVSIIFFGTLLSFFGLMWMLNASSGLCNG